MPVSNQQLPSATLKSSPSGFGATPTSKASTPQGSRPFVTFTQAPPPTPTDIQIMTESCDWCLTENPWDDDDLLFGNGSNDENVDDIKEGTVTQLTPSHKKEGHQQVNLSPRQTFGLSILS